jgi:hypothetical protein
MLQCNQNPLRKQSILQFYKDCRRKDGNRFPEIFADLVGQWFTSPTIIPTFDKARDTFLRNDIIPVGFTSRVHQAIMDQTMIGWIHATKGLLAKTWLEVASLSYDVSGKLSKRPDGIHRIRQVVKALHHLTTEIWAGRNTALHASDQPTGPLSILEAEIVRYHREPELLLKDDSFYCEQSLHRLLSSGAATKRRWLHRVKRSRDKKAKIEKDQPRITKYFQAHSTKTPHQHHHNGRPPEGRQPGEHKSFSRSTTVQRLMTFFLQERAPNPTIRSTSTSPPPNLASSD